MGRKVGKEEFWMGLHDKAVEGSWKYTDGTRFDFSRWSPGEPNNSGNEDCAYFRKDTEDYSQKWNDMACTRKFPFVCKRQ